MASETDPFTQVYDALYELPWKREALCRLVRAGNRVSYADDDRDPVKSTVTTADLPELRLVPLGGTPHLQRTSSSSTWLMRFQWMLATADQRVHKYLFPVEWELLRAMADWGTYLKALTWKTETFARVMKLTDARLGMVDPEVSRGIKGWISVWACEVLMQFSTVNLIAEE